MTIKSEVICFLHIMSFKLVTLEFSLLISYWLLILEKCLLYMTMLFVVVVSLFLTFFQSKLKIAYFVSFMRLYL